MSGKRASVFNALCLYGFAGLASAAQSPDAAKEARLFLLRYVGLTATSDVAALEMYRDDARVRVSSWQGGREVQSAVASGKGWKQQLRSGWFDGTTRMEASSFQEAQVVAQGQRLVIHAKRYSQTRCYWDNSYAAVIEPDRNGQYQIVEERLSFQRDAFCPTATQAGTVALPGVRRLPVVAAGPATAAQQFPIGAHYSAQPSNVVPSGQGLPRLPAPMGATPARAGVPSTNPAALANAAGQ